MIAITFSPLFTVELLHSFYLAENMACPDFSVTPSAKTQQVLSRHKAVAGQFENQLNAGVNSSNASGSIKPIQTIEDGMQMTFFMTLNNPLFVNYTCLPFVANKGQVYYFTNRNSNVSGKNFLTQPIPLYDSTKPYPLDSLVTDGTGAIFSAILSNGPAPATTANTTNTAYWFKVPNPLNYQFASTADMLWLTPTISIWQLTTPAPLATIQVLGYDPAVPGYTKPVYAATIPFAMYVSSFQLDLSILDPGKYSITVNGVQRWIYVNDELSGSGTFAVIDIYNDATPAPAQLVDASQVLQSPLYSILFLNRATIWKYVLNNGSTGVITGPASFPATAANPIASVSPIPLTDTLLALTLSTGGDDYTVASADAQRFTTIGITGNNYLCSEIFLNY